MATVYERVRKLTIEQLGIKDDSVTAVSSLSDLGADSLDMVELVMSVEKEFSTENKKLSIPDEEMEKMVTVQDIVEFVKKQGFTDYQPQKTNNYASQPRYGKYPNKNHGFMNKNNKNNNSEDKTESASDESTQSSEQTGYKRKYYHRYSSKSSKTYKNND